MAHSLLAPSAAHRWLNCPQSVRLTEKYPDTGSEYAAEGSAAHALAESVIGEQLEAMDVHVIWSHKPAWRPKKSSYYNASMQDYIDGYAAQIVERVLALNRPVVLLEERVSLEPYVPRGYGTSDVVIISDGTLEVIDLKYGTGVPVDAERNPQLMLYGLGALVKFEPIYDIETVAITVIQPRLDAQSTYTLPATELEEWASGTVGPTAQLALKGEGGFQAGEWCRFCPAKAECRTRADKNLELLKLDFALPATLSPAEIASILPAIERMKAWGKDVEEYALKQALSGTDFPGYKVVEGSSRSHYTDESRVAEELISLGYAEDDVYRRKLIGMTDLKKMIGVKEYNRVVKPLTEKPPGKPALVPEPDKRAPMKLQTTAEEDFSVIDASE